MINKCHDKIEDNKSDCFPVCAGVDKYDKKLYENKNRVLQY